jgi:Fe-S cluster assembly protein SufD
MSNIVQDRFAEVKERFHQLFEAQELRLNGMKDHPLHRYRKEAIKRLDELNFPTRRDEEWKYTSVNRVIQPEYREGSKVQLTKEEIAPFIIEGLDAHLLVFVNGIYDEALSYIGETEKGLSIHDLGNALKSNNHSETVAKMLNKFLLESEDAFRSLNAAFIRHGLYIHVAANKAIEKPIYCLHLSAPGDQPTISNTTMLVNVEKGSEVSVITGHYELPGAAGTYFENVANFYQVAQNAHAHHYRLQQQGKEGFMISNVDVEQDRDSTFSSYVVDLGGRLIRNNMNALHLDSGITTNYYSTYFGKEDQHIDNHTFIDHAVPHCQSNELYKGILTDKARGVFNGKVMVRRDAQKTNAFQQNSSLVLSDKAQMDSKPQLEIYADDVRCSHGATIGQLDEKSVYYLRSRGLSDQEARRMLQQAFIGEVLETFKHEAVQAFAEQMIIDKFED